MRRIFFILILPAILTGVPANSDFAQTRRASAFEIVERRNLHYGGHNVGKLYVTVAGMKRKIADEAAHAWIINHGKEIVYSGGDGAGGFENVGQSLRIYDVGTGKTRKIFSEYFPVGGITEVRLSSGALVLLVGSDMDESGVLSFAVVDPKRGEVFVNYTAVLLRIEGDFITLATDEDEITNYLPDEAKRTAFAVKAENAKPTKIKRYDLKKLLKRKVIYNRHSD